MFNKQKQKFILQMLHYNGVSKFLPPQQNMPLIYINHDNIPQSISDMTNLMIYGRHKHFIVNRYLYKGQHKY